MAAQEWDKAVETFLEAFDGDVSKATESLVHYIKTHKHRLAPKKPKRPLSDEIAIEVTDVKKHYKVGRQRVEALRGVTLQVHKGEFVALTGPSGSGKSTLLQSIGALDKVSEGVIKVNGVDLSRMGDRKLSVFRNKTIGFVFQFFYLQPFLRLEQNLEVAGIPSGTSPKARREYVAKLAKLVGLEDRLRHFPRELSGGQMQRAAIARALLNEPSIILADEPTGNLDSENGKAIIDLFETIRDTYGTTIIVVTHDHSIAARADREIRMKDGAVV